MTSPDGAAVVSGSDAPALARVLPDRDELAGARCVARQRVRAVPGPVTQWKAGTVEAKRLENVS